MKMFKSTFAGAMTVAIVVSLFFLSFCNAPGSIDIKEHNTSPVEVPAAVTIIGGYMDTLYIDIPTFLLRAPRKRKLVFKYYITADDSLTLYGWRTKKDNVDDHDYDLTNALILKNGGADTSIRIGPGSFLGGVVLTQDEVDTIRDIIAKPANASMRFVLFKPQKDPIYAGQVYYEIFLVNYEPKAGTIHTLVAPVNVGVGANPSPPRKS